MKNNKKSTDQVRTNQKENKEQRTSVNQKGQTSYEDIPGMKKSSDPDQHTSRSTEKGSRERNR